MSDDVGIVFGTQHLVLIEIELKSVAGVVRLSSKAGKWEDGILTNSATKDVDEALRLVLRYVG